MRFGKNAFWTLALVSALSWLNLVQPLPASAFAQSSQANLSSEKQALVSYANELAAFERKLAELQKKPRLTANEINALKTSQAALKARLPQVQSTFQSAINKLKAAKEWDNLDAAVLARSNKAKGQANLREFGGARRVLESMAQLSAMAAEMEEEVKALNAKVALTPSVSLGRGAFGFAPVSVSSTPVAMAVARLGIRCRFRVAVYVITGTDSDFDKMGCVCDGKPPDCSSTN